jgi:hypothetical protein
MTKSKVFAPLFGGPNDGATLSAAITVSEGLKAHLEVCFVCPDPKEAVPYLGLWADHLDKIKEEYRRHAETTGKKAANKAGLRPLDAQRARCLERQSFPTFLFLPGRRQTITA